MKNKNKNKTKTSVAPIAPAAEERSTNNPKEFVDEYVKTQALGPNNSLVPDT